MTSKIVRAIGVALLLCLPSVAHAQQTSMRAMVVSTCGGAGFPLTVSGNAAYEPLTMLQNGNLCTNGSAGGGTVTANQGTPASAANAWTMSVITGGTPVSSSNPFFVKETLLDSTITGIGGVPAAVINIQVPGGGPFYTAAQPSVSGKVTKTLVSLAANTSTTLVAANANRIGARIQCQGLDVVNIDETGGTLTGAILEGTTTLPAGSYPLYLPDFTSQTAYTGYTKTAQSCRVTETSR